MNLRETMIDYGMRFVGKPYVWGGSGVIGFDCSGLVRECLASVGLAPTGKQTLSDLRAAFESKSVRAPDLGVLAFFGTKEKITNVTICIGNGLMLEVGRGSWDGIDPKSANKIGAMVRVRPIAGRKNLMSFADPFDF